jgi:hypothetical protein
MLLIRFRSIVKPLAIGPLVLLGQSSLQVFCTHFVFCFLGIGMMGDAERILGWRQVALIGGTFAALLLVAKIHARPELSARTGNETGPAAQSPSIAPAEREFTRAA